ncbi:AAA family ATPase [Acidovorax sp. NCPPB 3859]|nr:MULTISPECIES: ExeA family protein [unclassified Acidovorax]MDA8450056.1 AAA family ATPase [Acidovorax sp. GBBC 3297]MDA8459599.1 AAA family ATPase [Acidovorax sp. GBBC 3333]MDA8464538.1 AAA family ATPase [Acidovorax sp. GBBC 3332]MDA8469669.1 AAA family ATPase [Acidovorax sp. GBBC 3299]WCM79364.1 AAA family ATPase [Acidovorax sp. GBBC 712]
MPLAALHARLGLVRNPFPPTPDASAYFFTTALEEQFAEVMHCIRARKGFVLLTGEVGLGKTTFVRRLLDTLPEGEVRSALVFNTFLQRESLLSAILRDFGLEPSGDMDEALTRLNRFLLDEHRAGRTCLLVIDDAQNLQPASLELVRLLCNLETGQEKLLQIVLSGQPELEAMLDGQDLRQLKSRIVKHARLRGLEAGQVLRYFEMRVSAAGAAGRIALQPRAARQLHRATGGNLRRIHLVLDRCMYGLAAQGGGAIDGRLLRAALDDLDGGGPPAQRRPGWHALLALGGLGMAAIGVGAAYVWPVAPAPAAPAAVVARPSDAAPGQPAAEPSQASPAPDVGARPAAGVPSATLDEPSAPPVAAASASAVVAAASAPASAPLPAASAVSSAVQATAEAGAGQDEQRCLTRIAAESQGRPMVRRVLPAAAAGRLQPSEGLCLFDRDGQHWAFWRDTLDRAAYVPTPQATPAGTALQRALVRQGVFDAARVDGFYGPQTVAALAAFQGRMGLPATAVPDELTYMLLEKMNAAPASGARVE